VGPGLGTDGDASEFARELVAKTTVPIVIDADGLNAFAGKTELLKGAGRTMVLTPHPGEMARLAGKSVQEIQKDRLKAARDFVQQHGVTLVLKGSRTLVAHPDGRVAVNTSGNPGMAKGGSGDLLTGVIAGLLAQFKDDVARAVEAAVYLHGFAADLAVHDTDERTLLATDSLKYFSRAFQFRSLRFSKGHPRGYVWMQGLHSSLAARSAEVTE
jgi:ADP-dependent NAD(P)H-hydrate dehydratase / NAD(P)H-hydrate epimerase